MDRSMIKRLVGVGASEPIIKEIESLRTKLTEAIRERDEALLIHQTDTGTQSTVAELQEKLDEEIRLNAMGQERELRLTAELSELKGNMREKSWPIYLEDYSLIPYRPKG